MSVTKKQVERRLKPKVARFGFKKNVIKSLAAQIAENLDVEDNASEEDINKAIDDAIAEQESTFALIQSQSMALLDEWKKESKKDDDEDEDDDEEEESNQHQKKSKSKSSGNKKDVEDIPAWAKTLIETTTTLAKDVAGIKGEKLTSDRRSILEEKLKDSGQFGKTILSQFERMNFKSDDDFNDFVESLSEDLDSLDQERANAGLKPLTKVSPKGKPNGGSEIKVLTDDDIKELASS